jgi:uncharacterized protein YgbK (DUF1537 family)
MRGLHPVTVPLIGSTQHSTARVLAVTTESRDLPPAEIRQALSALAATFPVDSAALVFKKIDSTLRGNTGIEIVAALESFHCDAAVVCPAFPGMRRIVERGVLSVTGVPEFQPIHVAQRLQLQSGHPCGASRSDRIAELLRSGARVVSVDATCDEDLDRIAATLLPMGRRVLWAGSAGLASALARLVGEQSDPPPVPARSGATLFCIGSDHAVTLAQQDALLAGRASALVHLHGAARQSICAALARGEHVILRIPRGQVPAETLREWIDGLPLAALVLSGGDTASLVCRAAGVQRIELCDEIVSGVPRGILHGGAFDGLPVATKSGGFGDRDTLIHVADFFHAPSDH